MYEKNLLKIIGFLPKENNHDVYYKTYAQGNTIEVNFNDNIIKYGKEIKSDSKTTQNLSQTENFVVLECIDRLLLKGYKPNDIILEKKFPLGHNFSGRLDILVKNGNKSFLMIECKTWGKEFEKELANIHKKGGQLFTYFQNDTNTDYLMLYASRLVDDRIEQRAEIIKIEDNYRTAGNVEDVYNRWNKITSANGIFEDWVEAYKFQSKLITKKDLIPLTEEDSRKIFNRFASILRKHSVSDKPNAFNKIFNLFLAKIYDEGRGEDEELHFQWIEGKDDPVEFQVRLINLHKEGLFEFLKKEIAGISNDEFNCDPNDMEALYKKKKEKLKFNKIFDIKDVIDDESFEDNFRVLKEVVQLLEKYQIRYPRRQQHLSDFFERLLATGLKQEAGQFFTPTPITRFIVRSLPTIDMVESFVNKPVPKLPAVIDFAAGSGHFVTEILETYQDIIEALNINNISIPDAKKKVNAWRSDQYSWATHYIYGIEKDYRLVKVAKVGCYFYGDGLAQIFHADGLDSFTQSKNYEGLLKKSGQFDIVVSNPPYSVDAFKGDLRNKNAKEDFTLYPSLTDKSDEIECLFVERTAQLLKDNGIAGIILPSTILSNTGIYTKTREIILKKFYIIAITELGSNTFMETTTNTVILFLKRRNDSHVSRILETVESVYSSFRDVTVNGIENAVTKYLKNVWQGLSFSDYKSFLEKKPNKKVKEHILYKEYRPKEYSLSDFIGDDASVLAREYAEKKLKQIEDTFWDRIIKLEKEKFLYFVLAYPQIIVIVKTGEKDAEKKFLGYEFSNRRGSEGMHPIERSMTVDECTQLYDSKNLINYEKASTYIYRAFSGDVNSRITLAMQNNVFRRSLIDMLIFDQNTFEKNISLTINKKDGFKSKWSAVKFEEVAEIIKGVTYSKSYQTTRKTDNIILTADNITLDGKLEINKKIFLSSSFKVSDEKRLRKNDIFICFSSGSKEHLGKVAFIEQNTQYLAGGFMGIIRTKSNILPKYLYLLFNYLLRQTVRDISSGTNINNLSSVINKIKIPLPSVEVQEKIIGEMEIIKEQEQRINGDIISLKNKISEIIQTIDQSKMEKIKNLAILIKRGKSAKYGKSSIQIIKSGQAKGYYDFDFSEKYFVDNKFILDDRQLQKEDILINSTGVGTAGRVTLFTLDGDFVVDSHITILRINREKALPVFVLYFLAYGIGFKSIEAMAQGQSGQIELSLPIVENIKIPFITIQEQQKLVSKISDIEIIIRNSQKQLEQLSLQYKIILEKYL